MTTPSPTERLRREVHDLLVGSVRDVASGRDDAWRARGGRMAGWRGTAWAQADHLARRSTWNTPSVTNPWKQFDAVVDDPFGVALAVASLHVNGLIRERATAALGATVGPVAAAALALRLSDHVAQVRAAARDAWEGRLDAVTDEELDAAVDVLLATRARLHGGVSLDWFVARTTTPDQLTVLRNSDRQQVRRWALAESRRRGDLDTLHVVDLACTDADQQVRTSAATWLLDAADGTTLDAGSAGRLVASEFVEARLAALALADDEALSKAALERSLLAASPREREQARWRARRRGVDVIAFHRSRLDDERPAHVARSVHALTTLAAWSDGQFPEQFLDHPATAVRAAAARASGVVAAPRASAALVPLLHDPSSRVSGAAAEALVSIGAPAHVVREAWDSPRAATRRAALRVARSARGWEGLAAHLRALTDDDPQLRLMGETGLSAWIQHEAAGTRGAPDDEQWSRIEPRLDVLPEQRADWLRFVAGRRRDRRHTDA